jgi:hypothetical protein
MELVGKMAKKWVMLKRGLIDAEHRERMGNTIWLYLRMVDRAEWGSGQVLEWRDQDEADFLGLPIKTLRWQRQHLEDEGYIVCRKRKHHQTITILRWIDPRNGKSASGLPLLSDEDSQDDDLNDRKSPNKSPNKPIRSVGSLHPNTMFSGDHVNTFGTAKSDESATPTFFEEPEKESSLESALSETTDNRADLIKAGFLDLLGAGGCLYRGEGRTARRIADKWTPDQLSEAYRYYKAQTFWADKRLGLAKMLELLPEYFAAKARGQLRPTGAAIIRGRSGTPVPASREPNASDIALAERIRQRERERELALFGKAPKYANTPIN